MKKRKKKMRKSLETGSEKSGLPEQIKKITSDLYYTSETNAEIFPFTGKKVQAVTAQEILNQSGNNSDAVIEEKDFTQFFAHLTEIQEWCGDEEKAAAAKFSELKQLLVKNLKNLRFFKIGEIQLDLYVVGIDAENNLMGIMTKAIET